MLNENQCAKEFGKEFTKRTGPTNCSSCFSASCSRASPDGEKQSGIRIVSRLLRESYSCIRAVAHFGSLVGREALAGRCMGSGNSVFRGVFHNARVLSFFLR